MPSGAGPQARPRRTDDRRDREDREDRVAPPALPRGARASSVAPLARDGAVLVGLFVVTLALQWASGAHVGALGAEPDEPSHYVTGVLIRDYLAAGLPGDPVAFARDFYVRYPRVGFGLWPPAFHLLSGVWMLAFGVARESILGLLAALTTAWAFTLYRVGRPVVGTVGAALSALLLVLLPATQRSTMSVMIDIPVAAAMLPAMAAYVRYLERERSVDALLFGACAGVAVLVKYDALALAMLPPACVVLTGRYALLRRPSFWLPAAVVLLMAGPWFVIMRDVVAYAAAPGADAPSRWRALAGSASGIVALAGPVVFALAAVGSVVALRSGRGSADQRDHRALYVAATVTVLAEVVFHGVVYPLYEPRYLLSAAPALVILTWPAVARLRTTAAGRPLLATCAALLAVATHAATTFALPRKRTASYVRVADTVLASGLPHGGAVLVSADAKGEGMLTAEFAMRDRRPDHYVVRATKVLASQTLMGDDYRLRYGSPEAVMAGLDSIPVAAVVVQRCPGAGCGAHEALLERGLALHPERWELFATIPGETGAPIRVYRIVGNEDRAVRRLRLDMTHSLGTVFGTP